MGHNRTIKAQAEIGLHMTFTLEDAIIMATNAHRGQTDKVGEPYILHPLRVMFSFEPYMVDQRITAVLHDVLEDTTVTVIDMFEAGVPNNIIAALVCLDHRNLATGDKEPYADYIERVKRDPLATQVKIADITDNTSMERLLRLDRETTERLLNKYNAALRVLQS